MAGPALEHVTRVSAPQYGALAGRRLNMCAISVRACGRAKRPIPPAPSRRERGAGHPLNPLPQVLVLGGFSVPLTFQSSRRPELVVRRAQGVPPIYPLRSRATSARRASRRRRRCVNSMLSGVALAGRLATCTVYSHPVTKPTFNRLDEPDGQTRAPVPPATPRHVRDRLAPGKSESRVTGPCLPAPGEQPAAF